MKKIRFYRVNLDYIKYLWNYDNKVQYNIDKFNNYNKRRPYIGIVFSISNFQYFAPLEHPREGHKTLKNNVHIMKINDGRYGLIAFNNMIPVNESELVHFDFKDEGPNYQKILINQFIFCDNNRNKIFNNAEKTYNKVVKEKIPFFINVCCNFKLLEQKCLEYEIYVKSVKEVAITKENNSEND